MIPQLANYVENSYETSCVYTGHAKRVHNRPYYYIDNLVHLIGYTLARKYQVSIACQNKLSATMKPSIAFVSFKCNLCMMFSVITMSVMYSVQIMNTVVMKQQLLRRYTCMPIYGVVIICHCRLKFLLTASQWMLWQLFLMCPRLVPQASPCVRNYANQFLGRYCWVCLLVLQ